MIAILLSLFSICLILATSFLIGCGNEGDSPTEMVGDMDDHDDHDHDQLIVVPTPDPDEPEAPSVSFKNDILPIFAESCALTGCHVGGPRGSLDPRGGLDLSNYDSFSSGGNNGAAFVAGDGDGSLIVKRIDLSINPLMPMGGPQLSPEQIQLFIDWIDDGAENN